MQIFRKTIDQNWSNHFQCSLDTLQQDGTTLLPEDKYSGKRMITLWHIGKHTFVIFDPLYTSDLKQILTNLPIDTSLSGDHLKQSWGANEIKSHDIGLIHYLYPADLPQFTPPATFSLRQLAAADQEHLLALHNSCTPEEVDDGYVEIDHEVIFGCFSGNQLVAAASGYRRTGFMDIGVLTHTGFRKRGLGKAVVGALCEWSSTQNIVAQYRCNTHNLGSHQLARSLNFQHYFKSESITLA